MAHISKHSFTFLNQLKKNNHREWFAKNRSAYEKSLEEMTNFAQKVREICVTFDGIETSSGKKSLGRIYRDVRFSKDKSPYKLYWQAYFKREGAHRRGSYICNIQSGNSFIAGGFFGPNSEDLRHIRNHLAADAQGLRKILEDPEFQAYFGQMKGEQLKIAPKGFDKLHPDIDLLRYKQFIIRHSFRDEEVLADDFEEQVALGFQKMLPFLNAMTEILTTDLNGISLLK